VHGCDPNPGNGPVVRSGLKKLRINPSGAQRSGDSFHISLTRAEHSYVGEPNLICR
jgi:hypothetical protein